MAATTLLTSDQFLALPDEPDQYGNSIRQELICGEVISVPRPSHQHDIVCANILRILILHVALNKTLQMTVLPEIAFVVTPKNVFVPDVSIIATERLVRIGQKYIPRAPELAVEVVSPSEGAVYLKMKTDAYLANGSRSVWIVFPETRSVMIYTSESVREVKGHQLIEDPLLPGFSCPVSAFFELT